MTNKASSEIMGVIGHVGTSSARETRWAPSGDVTPASRSFSTLFHTVFALGVFSVLSGCAIWSGNVVRYHIIDYPTPKKQSESQIPDTLMVYRFLLADTVDIHHLVVTTTDEESETVPLQRWELDPSDMVTELIQRDLEASGMFKKTVDQWSNARYRYALEGTIQKLEGTIRNGKAAAVLDVEATLTDFESPLGAKKNIMKKEYSIEVPSVDSKPVSIVRAVNLAVRELSERIRADIAATLTKEDGTNLEPTQPDGQRSPVKVSASVQRAPNFELRENA